MPPIYPGSYVPNNYFQCPDDLPTSGTSPTTPPTKTPTTPPKSITKDLPFCSVQPKITPKPSKKISSSPFKL